MKSNILGKTGQHYQKRGFSVFFTFLPTKSPKCMEVTSYGEVKRALRETCIMSVFEVLMYQKAKMHE